METWTAKRSISVGKVVKDRTATRLAMSLLPRVGPKTVLRSFAVDNSEELAFPALVEATLKHDLSESTLSHALDSAWRILNESADSGVHVLAFDDPEYPAPLRLISDPPPFLYVKGRLPDLDVAVAVIGTRQPEPLALEAASNVVSALATDPRCVIVSGLALGIDTRAHEQAVHRGVKTIAVLANGLDTVYPKANQPLANEILESGGALISEIPIGQRVTTFNLVARDRLQSGLSIATVLVQSSLDGGSMHTARYTLEQGRALIALKPLAKTENWSGNRFLTTPAQQIDWHQVPEKIQRFKSFPRRYGSYALRLSLENLDKFFEMGLKKRFIPSEPMESKQVEEPPLLRLNL